MPSNLIAEVQELLGNAEYLGDGYVKVLTQDIEALQVALTTLLVKPNEVGAYYPKKG